MIDPDDIPPPPTEDDHEALAREHAARVEAARLHHAREAQLPVPGALAAEVLRLRRLCETGREALAPIAGAARRSDLCEDDPLDAWGHELALSINDLRERAEKAEAERDELRGVCDDLCVDVNRAKDARDELRATAREWFAADASAAEAEDAATHAWGRESGPAIDALHAANVRRSAARERLRTLAGEGGE